MIPGLNIRDGKGMRGAFEVLAVAFGQGNGRDSEAMTLLRQIDEPSVPVFLDAAFIHDPREGHLGHGGPALPTRGQKGLLDRGNMPEDHEAGLSD